MNRVLSFTYKNFEGKIPNPGQLRESDEALLQVIKTGFESVAAKLEQVELKAALAEVMSLAGEVNKYLDVHALGLRLKPTVNRRQNLFIPQFKRLNGSN